MRTNGDYGSTFVPLNDVRQTFLQLYGDLPDAVHEFAYYFDYTYLRGRRAVGRRQAIRPLFPPPTWNVYESVRNREERINHIVESFYSKFQLLLAVRHISLCSFIENKIICYCSSSSRRQSSQTVNQQDI